MSKHIITYRDGTTVDVEVFHPHRLRAEIDLARMGIKVTDAAITWMTHAVYHALRQADATTAKYAQWEEQIADMETVDDAPDLEDDAPKSIAETHA